METSTPAPNGTPAQKPGKGLAITGLVLGIVAIVIDCIPCVQIFAILPALLAIIFGACGFKHGMGKAGLILGIVALVIAIYCCFVYAAAASDAADAVSSLAL